LVRVTANQIFAPAGNRLCGPHSIRWGGAIKAGGPFDPWLIVGTFSTIDDLYDAVMAE
jgi:hypothetical protein